MLFTLEQEERFLNSFEKLDGCWLWTRVCDPKGYGKFKIGRKQFGAHRLMWRYIYGEIEKGLFVCHKCDNPPCVNPDHLFLGTLQDNTRDMLSKGRGRGEGCITDEVAILIKAIPQDVCLKAVAVHFKTSDTHIRNIIKGISRSYLPPPSLEVIEQAKELFKDFPKKKQRIKKERIRKERDSRGSVKLTAREVNIIRAIPQGVYNRDIAKFFKVSSSTISSIKNKRSRTDLPPPSVEETAEAIEIFKLFPPKREFFIYKNYVLERLKEPQRKRRLIKRAL